MMKDNERREAIKANVEKNIAWAKKQAATGKKRLLKKETFAPTRKIA